jgi:hypothetical protein
MRSWVSVLLGLWVVACGAAPPRYPTFNIGEKYRGEETGSTANGHVIRYFTPAERDAAELHACGGKLCDRNGKLLDPEVASHPERGGTLMYVMAPDGTLYGTFDAKLHVVHHSSLLAGQPVACAGDMVVVQGEVLEVDNASGHYKPSAEALDNVVQRLRAMGVDLGATKFKYFGLPDRVPAPERREP